MGWASAGVSRQLLAVSRRRRATGTPRPGDVPEPDGTEKISGRRYPWWFETAIAAWDAERPSTQAANRNLPDGTKLCTKCQQAKPRTEFSLVNDNRGGKTRRVRLSVCKACRSAVALAWNEANPDAHSDNERVLTTIDKAPRSSCEVLLRRG